MECRIGCGACCIAPSISSSIPGMANGKPAGVRCVHLNSEYRCMIFDDPSRPDVCRKFVACIDVCGNDRNEALALIEYLESETA